MTPKNVLKHPAVRWAWQAGLALGDNNVFGLASQLAYNFLFALFPFLLSLVALASYLPEHDLIDRLLAEIGPFVPASSVQLITDNVHRVVSVHHTTLISIGFVLGVWSNSGAIYGLLGGLNLIYGVRDSRSVLHTRLLAIGVTLATDLLAILALLLVIWGGSLGRFVSQAVGNPAFYSDAWAVMRWPVAGGLLFTIVLALYWILPDIKLGLRDILWGALAASLAWIPATLGFSRFLAWFPNFGAAYGSLATVIVLLTWLYLNSLILLLGGQLNALLKKQGPADVS